MQPKEIIEAFYTAFQNHDAEAMVSLYADDVKFSDPVFQDLRGEEARDMWRMLIERGGEDLKIFFGDVLADNHLAITRWEGTYTFKPTGRQIRNRLKASFEIENGKIISHQDCFSLMRWFMMAFGTKGIFYGIFPPARKKLRMQAMKLLKEYREKRKS